MPHLKKTRLYLRLLTHHLPLLAASALSVSALYFTRPYRDVLSRASFATAYPALLLLALTLLLGPWKLLRNQRQPVSDDLRRDIGIWAGILGILHAIVGQCVHLRGRPWLYYVYERRSKHVFPLRHDLFGAANHTGAIATLLLIALLATSSDYALRAMGTPGWKKLQRWNYAIFGLTVIHAFGYQSIEKQKLPFVTIIAITTVATIALQAIGYWRRRAVVKAAIR
jgi:methionine sulfoxide reductase heme-binding subunit